VGNLGKMFSETTPSLMFGCPLAPVEITYLLLLVSFTIVLGMLSGSVAAGAYNTFLLNRLDTQD
jgi:hypothetical protein